MTVVRYLNDNGYIFSKDHYCISGYVSAGTGTTEILLHPEQDTSSFVLFMLLLYV
ncbi:MAG: hypothetical protein WBB36_02505 [Chitinophagales bacterium]